MHMPGDRTIKLLMQSNSFINYFMMFNKIRYVILYFKIYSPFFNASIRSYLQNRFSFFFHCLNQHIKGVCVLFLVTFCFLYTLGNARVGESRFICSDIHNFFVTQIFSIFLLVSSEIDTLLLFSYSPSMQVSPRAQLFLLTVGQHLLATFSPPLLILLSSALGNHSSPHSFYETHFPRFLISVKLCGTFQPIAHNMICLWQDLSFCGEQCSPVSVCTFYHPLVSA